MQNDLSEFDSKLLTLLSANARTSWAELASELEVSAPAVTAHVRALEERGVLRGFTALVDAESVGPMLTAFVFVTLGASAAPSGIFDAGAGVAGGDGVPPCCGR